MFTHAIVAWDIRIKLSCSELGIRTEVGIRGIARGSSGANDPPFERQEKESLL